MITPALGPAEHLDEMIAAKLKPVAEAQQFIIKDTKQFVNIIDELNATMKDAQQTFENVHSINMDVENMYPSISHKFGLANLERALIEFKMEEGERNMILAGCKLLLKNCYSRFNGELYHVTDGGSMGPCFMPSYADIAMVKFDNFIVAQCKKIGIDLLHYGRFRDDINMKIRGEVEDIKAKLDVLRRRLHGQSRIRFTFESKIGARVNDFLDVKEIIRNDRIAVDVYTKPTNTHTYLERSSVHPHQTWKSVINTIGHRLRMISDDKFLEKNLAAATLHLVNRGYNLKVIDAIFAKFKRMSKKDILGGKVKKNDYACTWSKAHRHNIKRNAAIPSNNSKDDADEDDIQRIWMVYKYHPSVKHLLSAVHDNYALLKGNE
jgi:hypothetical protein